MYDGIERVLFGGGLRFWLHKLLFLDSLSYLSRGQLSVSLQRLLLVDVDDIFVGERGTRLKKEDVEVCVNVHQVSVHENSFEMFACIAW